LSIDMKEAVKHATAEAMSVLVEELADCTGLDEVELEVELENNTYITVLLEDLRAAVRNKAQALLDAEVEKAQEQLKEEWETYCLPIIKEEYEQDGFIDEVARCEDWANFVDAACQNGDITEVVRDLIDVDVEVL
jgi:hypothetical protein